MRLNPEDENVLKNIKSQGKKVPVFYFLFGMSALLLSLFGIFPRGNSILHTFTLFLGGFLAGSGIEKFYNRKINSVCLKLHEDFKARNKS